MTNLECAARRLVALWDERPYATDPDDSDQYENIVEETRHECMLAMMEACTRPGFAQDFAKAVSDLYEALP